ncbi:MAG: T9SS type A sorting domain-containing protein [Flavobacteriales bacterium]|jgi:hypothetical protein
MVRVVLFSIFVIFTSHCSWGQVYGTPITTWDFANGIPSDWQSGIISTNSIAHWEYRGPSTSPDVNEGARGSCSAIAVPINSLTQENGFVIFDGNYWDDPGNACGAGFGTGSDPAPHTAWLTTNSVDLSGVNSAVLTFQQQYRHFQVSTKVFISTDGGTNWIEIIENTGLQSPSAEWKSINISEWAANQPDVRLKFQYEGTYYWWLLDDISIYEPNDNDLILTGVRYTNNTIVNGLTTLNDLEYHHYPLSMLPNLKFKADVLNVGGNAQTGARLNARVIKDDVTEVYNQSTNPTLLEVSASETFTMNGTFTPSTGVGDYQINYTILQDSIDDMFDNNFDSLDFKITTFTYGKDEGPMEDKYVPQEFYDEFQLSCGNYYENKSSVRNCHTIQVGLAEGTAVGKEIRGVIFNESLDTIIAYTPPYTVNYGDLNEPGEERLIYLDFESPFALQADSIYLVAVQELDSVLPFYVARSGKSFGESSLIRYDNINASIISTKSFLVRLTILPVTQIPGCTDIQAINYQSGAIIDDGSCDYIGCTNEDADNYDFSATFDDGSCQVGGCIDSLASNFNPFATYQNIACIYRGCTVNNALNYNPQANEDDGTCEFLYAQVEATAISGCPPFELVINNNNEFTPEGVCVYSINGQEVYNVCSSTFDYLFEEPGIYELTYSITIGNSIADTTISLEIYSPSEQPQITYDPLNHDLVCTNCFDDQLQWFFEGDPIENSNAASFNTEFDGITQNGDYQVITTNAFGCITPSDIITVVQPTLQVSAQAGCVPLTIYANNLTDTISGLTCSLNTGLTTIDSFNEQVEITFDVPGTYNVVLSCSTGLASGEVQTSVTVESLEIPILVIDEAINSVVCSNANAFVDFTWNIDGEIVTGNSSQPLGGDVYQLQAYSASGCGGSNLLIVNNTNELEDLMPTFYPNPADDLLRIELQKPGIFKVHNTQAQLVYESQGTKTIDVISTSDWPSGLYFIQWLGDSNSRTFKVEITH